MRRDGISRSPSASTFCTMRSIAASTYSVGTGRLCSARWKPTRTRSVSKSARLPLVFTTCGRRSSTVSYVVKRFWHAVQRRRRRIESPASETRESITCVSSLPQKGHFIVGGQVPGNWDSNGNLNLSLIGARPRIHYLGGTRYPLPDLCYLYTGNLRVSDATP